LLEYRQIGKWGNDQMVIGHLTIFPIGHEIHENTRKVKTPCSPNEDAKISFDAFLGV
jgi:hypothetical protein